jgi:hypothetical protein
MLFSLSDVPEHPAGEAYAPATDNVLAAEFSFRIPGVCIEYPIFKYGVSKGSTGQRRDIFGTACCQS